MTAARLTCHWPQTGRSARARRSTCRTASRRLTRWRVLARDPANGRSRLALEPVTGRSHQLRLHLSAIGHAILGDELYAPPDVAAATPRLMLHACWLDLPLPADDGLDGLGLTHDQSGFDTGQRLRISSPLPF